ncbi:MAG: MBL fold metallo-hydrolase [Myxococcota bacterium]
MAKFEVIPIGVGDSFSEYHHPTAMLLCYDGFTLAVDCPDMYRSVLRRASERAGRELDLSRIDDVLITHVHGDHMNGLEGVAFFKHFSDKCRTGLVASPEVREVIWGQRLQASMGVLYDGVQFREKSFEDYFDFTPLSWDRPTHVGPFEIQPRRTKHHVPTSALLVRAGGTTFGYSADTAFDPELIEFLSVADLIFHETNLGPAHTAYAELARLPAELRSRMRLIHYPDQLDLSASAIAPAREGDVLEVSR